MGEKIGYGLSTGSSLLTNCHQSASLPVKESTSKLTHVIVGQTQFFLGVELRASVPYWLLITTLDLSFLSYGSHNKLLNQEGNEVYSILHSMNLILLSKQGWTWLELEWEKVIE